MAKTQAQRQADRRARVMENRRRKRQRRYVSPVGVSRLGGTLAQRYGNMMSRLPTGTARMGGTAAQRYPDWLSSFKSRQRRR